MDRTDTKGDNATTSYREGILFSIWLSKPTTRSVCFFATSMKPARLQSQLLWLYASPRSVAPHMFWFLHLCSLFSKEPVLQVLPEYIKKYLLFRLWCFLFGFLVCSAYLLLSLFLFLFFNLCYFLWVFFLYLFLLFCLLSLNFFLVLFFVGLMNSFMSGVEIDQIFSQYFSLIFK